MGKHVTPKGVCNCPRGGNNEAVQIEVDDPEVGYRPTRIGAMRIEDIDGRTRPAVVRTHGRSELALPSAELRALTSSGSLLTSVGQCPGIRPTVFDGACMGAWSVRALLPIPPPPAPRVSAHMSK